MKQFVPTVLAVLIGVASLWGQSPTEEVVRGILGAAAPRSYLGVGVREIDGTRAKELRLSEERGVEVTQVDDESPASKAGLKVGDVVLEYNGQRVEGSEQFVRMVRETPVGRAANLKVSRGGASHSLSASIGKRKAGLRGPRLEEWSAIQRPENSLVRSADLPRPLLLWRNGILGIEAEGLGSQLAEFFGVIEGVLVRHVQPNSPGAKAGLKAGDVVLRVNDTKVTSPREITNAVLTAREKGIVAIRLLRNRAEISVNIDIREAAGARRPSALPVDRPQDFE